MIKPKLKLFLTVYLLSQVGFYIYLPLHALFASGLHIAPKDIALLWSYFSLLTAILILVFGKIENTRKKETFLAVGMLFYIIADLLLLVVGSFAGLAGTLTIHAFAGGMTFPAVKTLFAKNETRGRESEEWSWMDSGNMFAAAVGSAIGAIVLILDNFKGIFLSMAVMHLLAGIVALHCVRSHKKG